MKTPSFRCRRMPAQSGRHDIQAYAGRGGITLNHHKSPFIEQTDMANIQIIQGDFEKKLKLQFAPGIKAGFPSPAEDYSHETLDFNRDLIRNPEARLKLASMMVILLSLTVPSKLRMGILSLDISMMSLPSSISICDIAKMDISNCALQIRTSSLSASMQMMTLKCGAW